jgi:hypothetical protein
MLGVLRTPREPGWGGALLREDPGGLGFVRGDDRIELARVEARLQEALLAVREDRHVRRIRPPGVVRELDERRHDLGGVVWLVLELAEQEPRLGFWIRHVHLQQADVGGRAGARRDPRELAQRGFARGRCPLRKQLLDHRYV